MEVARTICDIRSQLPHIPDEIIEEILPRLSVKSLMRFKSVCKSWQAFISDKKFCLSKNERERECALVFNFRSQNFWFINYSVNHDLVVEQFLPSPLGEAHGIQILGLCNGLVLLYEESTMYLWNPSTRVCRRAYALPYLEYYYSDVLVSGLCYDDSTNDYKVVVKLRGRESVLLISSFKRKVWRGILSDPFRILDSAFTAMAPSVNGNLHLVALNSHGGEVIVYFDAKTDELKELPMPTKDFGRTLCLGVLDGCLTMIRRHSSNAEILVMREYGVGESWTIMFKMPFELPKELVPFYFTKNGDVLLQDGRTNVWAYNPRRDSLLHITKLEKNRKNSFHLFGFTYVESLEDPYTYTQILAI